MYTPLGRHPQADTPQTATESGGMHPTGMHSCYLKHFHTNELTCIVGWSGRGDTATRKPLPRVVVCSGARMSSGLTSAGGTQQPQFNFTQVPPLIYIL